MKFFRNLLIILTVLIGSISLYGFLLGERLLSPSFYSEALSSAGVYEQAANIIEARVEEALVTNSKELLDELEEKQDEDDTFRRILIWLAEDIVEKKAGDVVVSISDRIGLEQRLQSAFDKDIEALTTWLRGERESSDFFNVIPSVDSVDSLEEQGLLVHLVRAVAVQSVGVQDLPQCSSKNAEKEALSLIAEDNIKDVSCTSDTVQPLLEDKVSEGLPEGLVARLEKNFDDFLKEYDLGSLWTGVIEVLRELAQVKEGLLAWRTDVMWYMSTMSLGMSVALIAGILAVLFSPGSRVRTFINLNLMVSGVLLVSTALFALFFVNPIIDSLDLERFSLSGDYVTDAQNALWVSSVEMAGENLIRGTHDYVLRTGTVWFLATVILLGVYEYLQRGGWETWKRRISTVWMWLREKAQGLVDWWDGMLNKEDSI